MKLSKIINRAKIYLTNPAYRYYIDSRRGKYNSLEDAEYLKLRFHYAMGQELDLENPKTFNEKLQWLKLHNRKPIYTDMVDKYAAKQYVADLIGEEHIIPTLGVWDSFDEIDFDKLPDQFVLKCTHDSGGLVICRDKSKLDIRAAKKKLKKSLKRDFYLLGREWPYKDVPRRIIAEKYMGSLDSSLTDYKFYCFNGKPLFLYVSSGLEKHSTARISYVTLDWKHAPYKRLDYLPHEELPPKPSKLDEMIAYAELLSKNTAFLRVDLYQIDDEIYFSELTFFPGSGFTKFRNPEHDLEIGNLIKLPDTHNI